jgi:hypothetical protein
VQELLRGRDLLLRECDLLLRDLLRQELLRGELLGRVLRQELVRERSGRDLMLREQELLLLRGRPVIYNKLLVGVHRHGVVLQRVVHLRRIRGKTINALKQMGSREG